MFADYAALKSAIISWSDNSDVEQRVDDFISLVHVHLNRELRLEEMTVLAYIDTTPDVPWVVKPDEYLGMRRLKLDGVPGGGLDYKPLSEMDEDPNLNRPGIPEAYCVVGDRLRLGPIPEGVWRLETAYFKRQPTLTETTTTNVFLTEASDLLLYGALAEAEPWLKDHEMFTTWVGKWSQGLAELKAHTEAERFPSGDMQMRAV